MANLVTVLAVAHPLQGQKFCDYVKDPSYEELIEMFIKKSDFVFEEASGLRPSVAEELTTKILGGSRYLDIDPSRDERPNLGIAQKTGDDFPVDETQLGTVGVPDIYHVDFVVEHRKREEEWVRRVLSQNFERGLVICGIAHSLSIAFRLLSVGVKTSEAYSYTPYHKLCKRPHKD